MKMKKQAYDPEERLLLTHWSYNGLFLLPRSHNRNGDDVLTTQATKYCWRPLLLFADQKKTYTAYEHTCEMLARCETYLQGNDCLHRQAAHYIQDRYMWRAIYMDETQTYEDVVLRQHALFEILPRAFDVSELPDISAVLLTYNKWWTIDALERSEISNAVTNAAVTPQDTSSLYSIAKIIVKSLPHPCNKRALATVITKYWSALRDDGTPPKLIKNEQTPESMHHQRKFDLAVASEVFFAIRRVIVASLLGCYPRCTVTAKFAVRYRVYREFLWRGGCSPRVLAAWITRNEKVTLSTMREFLCFTVDMLPLHDELCRVYFWETSMRKCVKDADARRTLWNKRADIRQNHDAHIGIAETLTGDVAFESVAQCTILEDLLSHSPQLIKHSLLNATLRAIHKVDASDCDYVTVKRRTSKKLQEWKSNRLHDVLRVAIQAFRQHTHRAHHAWFNTVMVPTSLRQIVPLDAEWAAKVSAVQIKYNEEVNRPGLEKTIRALRYSSLEDYVTLRCFYALCDETLRAIVIELPVNVLEQQLKSYRRLGYITEEQLRGRVALPPQLGLHYLCSKCGRLDATHSCEAQALSSIVPSQKRIAERHDCSSVVIDLNTAFIDALFARDDYAATQNIQMRCYHRKDRRGISSQKAELDEDERHNDDDDDDDNNEKSDDEKGGDDDDKKNPPAKKPRSRRAPLAREMAQQCGEDVMDRFCLLGRQLLVRTTNYSVRIFMLCPHCLTLMRWTPACLHGGTISCGCYMADAPPSTQQQQRRCFICERADVKRHIIAWDETVKRMRLVSLCQRSGTCVRVPLHFWKRRLITIRELNALKDPHVVPVFFKDAYGDPFIVDRPSVSAVDRAAQAVRRYEAATKKK